MRKRVALLFIWAGALFMTSALANVGQDDETTAVSDSSAVVRRLTDKDALVRRRAAEDLAKAAEPQHKKLVEGYRLQEKDARVRLALDWALYRMGKHDTLYTLIRELDSKRVNQAQSYLSQLESPEPLYVFLPRVNGNTQARLLEVFALNGDATTLEQIKPFTTSLDPLIVKAAKFAEREINIRLQQSPATTPTRARRTGTGDDSTP